MNKYDIRQIPIIVWVCSTLILTLSLYFEFLASIGSSGLFWVLNLISVSLFSYYMGLAGGMIALLLILTVRIGVGLQTFTSLSSHQLLLALVINLVGFVTSISIGYMAGKLKANESNIRQLFNNNDITFWTRDVKTNKATVSEGYAEIYGVSRKDFERNPNLYFDSVHPDDKTILLDAIQKQNSGKRSKVNYRIHRSDGEIRWLEDRGTPIFDKHRQVTKVNGVIFDVTSQKETEEQMNKIAFTDALTGLPNRKWFQNYLKIAILSAKEKRKSIAVMFIDFDNFKRVNDTLGHYAGDELLQQIAKRLQSCIRDDDIVSRQGGDEFLVLVESTSLEEVEFIAQRIIRKMNDPYDVKGTEIFSTSSLGISIFPESGDNAETLIEKADFAMYLAKEHGKNNYQFYNDELNQKMKRKMMLEVRLHKAIEQEQLSVYYQPQIDLTSGRLAGAEALLRWENDLGKIRPNEFIPIAEETGLIIPIGEWILREACRHTKFFKESGLQPFPISVNISTKQLMNPHFIERLKTILHEEQVEANLLTLEITESALLFYEDAKNNIFELRKLGVGVSMDDFGVGYSSLSLIKDIEIDELKIDQSFLNDALENKRVCTLLESIIKIGKRLEARVVVEGVETAEQLELLIKQKVYGQGYFYCHPLPIKEFEQWYHSYYTKEKRN